MPSPAKLAWRTKVWGEAAARSSQPELWNMRRGVVHAVPPCAVPLSTQWPGDKVGGTIQDAVTIWKSKEGTGLWQNSTYFRASPSHSTEWNLNSKRRLSSAMELGA